MKIILALLGVASLILGVIGIFLPILPTVPFVLLSAYLFARSSSRMHSWIINHKTFGDYIQSYNLDKSIPLQVKVTAIAMLWISMFISIFFFFKESSWIQLVLAGIAIGVTIFLLKMNTKKIVK